MKMSDYEIGVLESDFYGFLGNGSREHGHQGKRQKACHG
jgi:hypothetical protein